MVTCCSPGGSQAGTNGAVSGGGGGSVGDAGEDAVAAGDAVDGVAAVGGDSILTDGDLTALAEGQLCVLAPLVRVMNDLLGLALPQRHIERREHQFGPQVRCHGPAHDAAAERI